MRCSWERCRARAWVHAARGPAPIGLESAPGGRSSQQALNLLRCTARMVCIVA